MTHQNRRFHGQSVLGLSIVALLTIAAPPATGATVGAPQVIGTNGNSQLDEISGLVDSRANSGAFWVHNDSGDAAQFYAVSRQGALLGTFPLESASASDWEDIAIGPKAGGGDYLYLGDIGDNRAERSSITVHRTPEPTATSGATIPVGGYTSLKLQYPGGPRDAESMFVDPIADELYIITKRTSTLQIYSVPTSAFEIPGQTVTLTDRGTVGGPLRWATGADISPDGRFVLVRSSIFSDGYLFERAAGQSAADALHGNGVSFPLGTESQGEAIGWAADGWSFFTTSEHDSASSAPIHSYAFAALAGDYNNDHRVDAADYTVWRNQMGSDLALPNEFATPNQVTLEDYTVWKQHFGESSGAGGAAIGLGVPEPASWLLTMFLIGSIAARRAR